MKEHRIAILGGGWVSGVHAQAFATIDGAHVVACWSRSEKTARRFAREHGIASWSTDWRALVERDDVDLVCVNSVNAWHAEMTLAALKAGKHVIVEKPLCLRLEDAEAIQRESKRRGLVVGYAEELCYAPKFVEAKRGADSGALGRLYFVKQYEKHAGPYSPWFFEREFAGGGVTMDMGCHAIEFCRWVLDKPRCTRVFAHMDRYCHRDTGPLEDHVVIHMEFETAQTALVESSWTLPGGMDSRAEIFGTEGVIYADLLQGHGLRQFSLKGEAKKPQTRGWSFPMTEWLHNNGYPQEMRDFLGAIETGETPRESVQDGRDVLEIMLAAYASAGSRRAVDLPFRPKGVKYPVDLWLKSPTR